MPITLSDTELSSIMQEVEQELGLVLKNEGAKLAKAKDGDDDDDGSSDSAPPAPDDGSAAPGGSAPAAPPDASASASAGAPPGAADGSAPPSDGSAPADPAAQGSAQGPMDVQSLTQEYSQLPDDVLEAHYVASKAALMERLQGQSASAGASPAGSPPASPSPSAPMASPPASPSPSAPPVPPQDPSAPPTQKAEIPSAKQVAAPAANGGKAAPMKKSEDVLALETQVAELRAQNEEQGKMVEGLAKATELLLTTPQRRAVTSVAYLAKTDAERPSAPAEIDPKKLSKSEVLARLSEKAKDATLKKSDRTLINQFCVGTAGVDVEKIAHLLK